MKIESSLNNGNGEKEKKDRSALESKGSEVKHAKELSSSATQRSLLDDSSSVESGNQAYITYRSCIPAVNEERFSVLGFEVSSFRRDASTDNSSTLYFHILFSAFRSMA